MNKIVIAGGSGFIGTAIANHFSETHEVVVLTRNASTTSGNVRTVYWNATGPGSWMAELEGAQVLINLTGKNVNCRYSAANKKEILESRTLSTRILGAALRICNNPPPVWIQMSSATIYRHSEDKPMDETFGEIGSDFSMDVCTQWEAEFAQLRLLKTRKLILRTSIVLGNGGGAFEPLMNLVRFGLGGTQGSGEQMVSWIHLSDLISIVEWLIQGEHSGIYNVTAPQPVRNHVLMKTLRKSCGMPFGIPTPDWLLKLGALIIGTETELILKSRYVIPKRLIQEGYRFLFPTLESAVRNLVTSNDTPTVELKMA